MQSLRPRQNDYFTLLWTGNGGRESQPLNLSPTRNFKRKVFIWKTCVILSHTALHFIYVLTLSEISKNNSFDRSKVFLNWSKYSISPFQSLWMTRSTLDSCLIDRKANPIDWKEFSINRKTEEIHYKVFGWLDRFLILVRSIEMNIRLIEMNIRSIEGNSRPVETRETKFFIFFW